MAQVYKFCEKEIEETVQARRENKDKRVEARLKALEMRARDIKASEIAEATGFHSAYIPQLAEKYKKAESKQSPVTITAETAASCGAADGRELLFGVSLVQYCLHECISAGSVQGVPG